MVLPWLKVFLLLWTVSVCSGDSKMEVRLESMTNIAGEEETLAVFKLRLVGRERFLNGTINFLVDIDNNYGGAIDVYSFKNGEWIQTYVKVRSTPCDVFRNYVKKYYLPPDADTNLPSCEDNDLTKGEYYLKEVLVSVENWPTFPTRGLIKIVTYFTLKGKVIGGYEVVANISDRRT